MDYNKILENKEVVQSLYNLKLSLKKENIDIDSVVVSIKDSGNIEIKLPEIKKNQKTKIAKALKGRK